MASLLWALVLLAGLGCSSTYASRLGQQTTIEEYPYVVQVEQNVFFMWLPLCTGSVLTSYHILTAASCFTGSYTDVYSRRIRAGTSISGYGGVIKEIYQVNRYPSYGLLGNEGDLAVVRVISPFNLGPTIQQTPILGEGIYLPAGLPITLLGWGSTTEGNPIPNPNLFNLGLYTVYNDHCLEIYEPQIITENMICAGLLPTKGRDLDGRDVGAPLLYSGVVVGVVSFGQRDGNDTFPIVATSVSSYSNWIVGISV